MAELILKPAQVRITPSGQSTAIPVLKLRNGDYVVISGQRRARILLDLGYIIQVRIL